ncbi:hypothetical protein Fcan01_20411 [Folsomia candida]|uniref:C-type lectin domain-containing protein n=1 Tax=Folsomia candida TaxID=158441 RepID=A0A226DFF2_FOLCA|nr:hypothetical protein Fcan01_20411 [Folsomia candida]
MAKITGILALLFSIVCIFFSVNGSPVKTNGKVIPFKIGNGTLEITHLLINELVLPYDALLRCENIYLGRLVTIYSAVQEAVITEIISTTPLQGKIITAGKFNIRKFQWEWMTTGEELTYRNFANQLDAEGMCCFKSISATQNYQWFAYNCDSERGVYICEVVI